MYLLGIDLGTSSVKVSVVDAGSKACIASARYPEEEAGILALQPGWAEQSPDEWWEQVCRAILKLNAGNTYDPSAIAAIGIAYQMHGLVLTGREGQALRNSIIWCDSRAVQLGEKAFAGIGEEKCLSHLLNSPGNFTASKLAWVKEQEPAIFERAAKFMLPGDFIAMKLTGDTTTTISALSEGIFWDFKENRVSTDVLDHFGFSESIIPDIRPVFSEHGRISAGVAGALGLKAGIPVSYKAGDQPNNALSLNVLEPGEVAATAGTSGVIYGVSEKLAHDPLSRINTFAHVNHAAEQVRTGILLCINGTGILNRWTRNELSPALSYEEMNRAGANITPGSSGLNVLPFGNGAERMLGNKITGANFLGLDLNIHSRDHLIRAVQEGIAFAFRYGLDIMRGNGLEPSVIRAGRANLFLSDLFIESFVNATGVPVALYPADGSIGAAIGAGIGAGIYRSASEAFSHLSSSKLIEPSSAAFYDERYLQWKTALEKQI